MLSVCEEILQISRFDSWRECRAIVMSSLSGRYPSPSGCTSKSSKFVYQNRRNLKLTGRCFSVYATTGWLSRQVEMNIFLRLTSSALEATW